MKPGTHIALAAGAATALCALAFLLVKVRERRDEARDADFRVANLTEDTVDPAEWGKNFPRQYDGYRQGAGSERVSRGGSEGFYQTDADPRPGRIFAGYARPLPNRRDRGHPWSLKGTEETARAGGCLECHASIGPGLPGNAPVACLDCHDPRTLALRISRPAFLAAFPGADHATRRQMRSFVCAQCHSGYYFPPGRPLAARPWSRGLKLEDIEAVYDALRFSDWRHGETGAPLVKARHPQFELWNQGAHARAGVACADCHMPFVREGAVKVTDHRLRSPVLQIERACLACHPFSAAEMKARIDIIQGRNAKLLERAEDALVALYDGVRAARAAGAGDAELAGTLQLQRQAQFRADFIHAEGSSGFHAPQEAARILGEAIDYTRQGQLAALRAILSCSNPGGVGSTKEAGPPAIRQLPAN